MKNFFNGVFWTLFIGMAAYIAYPHLPKEEGYAIASREEMTDAIRVSMEDLK